MKLGDIMQIEYVFADHIVTVTLSSDEDGFVGGLSDTDVTCLRQIIYLALSCFVFTRAMNLAERSQENGLEG